jgi:hypothetical protein
MTVYRQMLDIQRFWERLMALLRTGEFVGWSPVHRARGDTGWRMLGTPAPGQRRGHPVR